MQIATRFFRLFYIRLIWLDVVVFVLLIASALYSLSPFKVPIDVKSEYVVPVNSLKVTRSAALAHNSTVLEDLHAIRALDRNMMASREQVQMQARMFYCAILAVLLSLLSRSSRLPVCVVKLLAFGLISLMYLLDIHLEDLLIRDRGYDSVIGNSIDKMVNLPANDSTWYVTLPTSVQPQLDKAAERWERWPRKADLALRPSLPQIIYYVIPALAWYLFVTASRRKRKFESWVSGSLRGA